jgi:hypothetical protein
MERRWWHLEKLCMQRVSLRDGQGLIDAWHAGLWMRQRSLGMVANIHEYNCSEWVRWVSGNAKGIACSWWLIARCCQCWWVNKKRRTRCGGVGFQVTR